MQGAGRGEENGRKNGRNAGREKVQTCKRRRRQQEVGRKEGERGRASEVCAGEEGKRRAGRQGVERELN